MERERGVGLEDYVDRERRGKGELYAERGRGDGSCIEKETLETALCGFKDMPPTCPRTLKSNRSL